MNENSDLQKTEIYRFDGKLLDILLLDRSSKKNLIWATDHYASRGRGYQASDNITRRAIFGRSGSIIKPRVEKSPKDQTSRVKDKAEVFTPSWICNAQNNLVDNAWFGRANVFNTETEKGWLANSEKITFPEKKTWQDYVKENRLEITCGEAPYLVSRYDAVSGKMIAVKERIGLLDRKLRIVSENADSEKEWFEWAKAAYKSVYGFDWQGDNVFLARENLLCTFIDYFTNKFGIAPAHDFLLEIAEIISWNIWQMDGLKYVIPSGGEPHSKRQPHSGKGESGKQTDIYCVIKDWERKKNIKFASLVSLK